MGGLLDVLMQGLKEVRALVQGWGQAWDWRVPCVARLGEGMESRPSQPGCASWSVQQRGRALCSSRARAESPVVMEFCGVLAC